MARGACLGSTLRVTLTPSQARGACLSFTLNGRHMWCAIDKKGPVTLIVSLSNELAGENCLCPRDGGGEIHNHHCKVVVVGLLVIPHEVVVVGTGGDSFGGREGK